MRVMVRNFLAFILAATAWYATTATATEPINIGSRLELFVDDYLVEKMSGTAELQLHRPVERELAIIHDRPWEGNRSGYYTVFQDGDLYRMYYRGSQIDIMETRRKTDIEITKTHFSIPYNVTCYAESEDGIHWTRPELGLVEYQGSKKNNIILSGFVSHTFTPFLDANPDCVPEQRYKAFALLTKPTRALYTYSSPDGIHWSKMSDKPVITKGYFDSQNLPFWDSTRGEYREYHRDIRGPDNMHLHPTKGGTKDVMTSTSKDFVNWTEPAWLEYSPERWIKFSSKRTKWSPFVQFYTNQVTPYYRAPHVFFGFPTRYVSGREMLTPLNERIGRAEERYGTAYTDGGFMVSRDGNNFKVWPEAFIRPGPVEKGRWVYGDNFQALGIVETKPDNAAAPNELSVYANEGLWRAAGLRRFTLRIDGFVSVNASLCGGELVTKPIKFEGKELVMNFSTSAAGSIRAELQTSDGKPIEGFTLDDCREIFGDRIEQVVSWKDGSDVSILSGKPVRLRFAIKDADLYSIRFRK